MFLALLSCLACLAWTLPAGAADQYQDQAILEASKVLPANLLSGPGFRVEEKVRNDGFLNHYFVDSDFGRFLAVSTPALAKLEAELTVIPQMARAEDSEKFGEGLKKTAKNTRRGLKNLFTNPVGAAEGAAAGMGQLFDRVDEVVTGPPPGQSEDSRAEQALGYSQTKREIAAKFGVDVYSSNKVLQEYLDRLARAEYAGSISLEAVKIMIPGGIGLIMGASGATRLLNDMIRTTPPPELRIMNRDKLKKAGIPSDLTKRFIAHDVFSPRDQTYVAAAVEALAGVKDLELLVRTALQARTRDMSYVLTNLSAMYAYYHRKVAPLAGLKPLARVFHAQTAKGDAVLLLPADYVPWSQRTAEAMKAIEPSGPGGARELWISGTLSPDAARELAKAGWKVHDRQEKKFLSPAGEK